MPAERTSENASYLIGCHEIGPSRNGRTPTRPGGLDRAEVVASGPAGGLLLSVGMTIERPQANPQPGRVRVLHERAQARVVFRRPLASVTLAPRFNDRPRRIPPATIIRRARQRRRWQCLPEQPLRRLRVGPLPGRWAKRDGAEQTQFRPNRDCVGESGCLRVGGSREHEHGLHVQRSGLRAVVRSLRRGQPFVVFPEERPQRAKVLWIVRLQVEIENDEGPRAPVVVSERALDQRTDTLEKRVAQRGLLAVKWLAVRHDRPPRPIAFSRSPDKVLFDRQRYSCAERSIDAVGELSVVRIRVVGIQQNPRANRYRGRLWLARGHAAERHDDRASGEYPRSQRRGSHLEFRTRSAALSGPLGRGTHR